MIANGCRIPVTQPQFNCSLPPLVVRGRTLLPIVQGGMGVAVSAGRLAGTVAGLGAVGTIASIDLRQKHPDLLDRSRNQDKDTIRNANIEALDREIRQALDLAAGAGMVAVNCMKAVGQYADYVRQSCRSGAHAIVVGAGLPLDLPALTVDFPDVALIPILSDARGVQVLVRKWMRKGRLPDAVVIEHPRLAGGHLGASSVADLNDTRFDFEVVLPAVLDYFRSEGIDPKAVPLIPAGGINSRERIRQLIDLGASAVQVGTPFAVTIEGDAPLEFKKVLAEARAEDIVEFISVTGMPARAVRTPWLKRYLEHLPALKAAARRKRCTLHWDCITYCGMREGNAEVGQFCIDQKLGDAVQGRVDKGLFFRGARPVPFGAEIRPVRDLLEFLLNGKSPSEAFAELPPDVALEANAI
jgi:nitronate monooxygenase